MGGVRLSLRSLKQMYGSEGATIEGSRTPGSRRRAKSRCSRSLYCTRVSSWNDCCRHWVVLML